MESLRCIAPAFVKRLFWNRKNVGRAPNPAGSPILEFLAPVLPRDASLLDLGCGTGNLLFGLRGRGWVGHYTGVDISATAISTAKQMKDDAADWHVSAIEDFPIDRRWDVICLVESLYYVSPKALQPLLSRCRAFSGRTYIHICHEERHASTIERLGEHRHPARGVFLLEGT